MGWSNRDKKHGRRYDLEYKNYQGTEEQKKARAQRNAARAKMMKLGLVKKGDGMDVHHKRPIRSGGGNSKSNLAVKSKSRNRSFSRK